MIKNIFLFLSSFNTLFYNNKKLVYYFGKPYIDRNKLNNDQIEDLYQEGFVGLYNACKKYDETKNVKITTYSSYWIKSYMTKYIKNHYKNKHLSLNMNIYTGKMEPFLDINADKSLNVCIDSLTDLHKDIIIGYYYHRITKKALSKKYNMSVYELNKEFKKAIEILRNKNMLIEN